MYSRRLLPLLLLLLRSSICPVKAACRPVEEGQKTTLTCSLGKKTCSTNKFLDWILDSSNTKVIACTTNECGGFHSDYGIYAIVNNNGSTLTIPKVTRAGFLNMETKWICRPCTDSRREITACDKLEVYAKPENPTCAARRNMDQAGQFESLTVSCSTTKVYPKARCNFKRRTKGEMFVTINETLTYRHTQTNETPAYYRSECSVDVPVAELGEGTPSFKAFIYPDVTNGIDLVAATTVSAAANINAPFVTFTHNSTSSEYNEGDTPTFTCTAHGNPPPNLTLTRKRTTKQLASVQGNLKTAELTHTMEPLDCLDTDVYVCTGQNKHGVTTKEISIGVKCSQQLVSNISQPDTVEVAQGETAELNLEIYGYPTPQLLTLMRTTDNTNVTGSTRHHIKYLPYQAPFGCVKVSISDVTIEDFTNYTITVDNGEANESHALEHSFCLMEVNSTVNYTQNTRVSAVHGDFKADTLYVGVGSAALFLILLVFIVIVIAQVVRSKDNRQPKASQSSTENSDSGHRVSEDRSSRKEKQALLPPKRKQHREYKTDSTVLPEMETLRYEQKGMRPTGPIPLSENAYEDIDACLVKDCKVHIGLVQENGPKPHRQVNREYVEYDPRPINEYNLPVQLAQAEASWPEDYRQMQVLRPAQGNVYKQTNHDEVERYESPADLFVGRAMRCQDRPLKQPHISLLKSETKDHCNSDLSFDFGENTCVYVNRADHNTGKEKCAYANIAV